MYVCICAGVTEAELHACVDGGADTVETVADRCAAGTGCGTCVERLCQLIAQRVPGATQAA